jgi:hypothetical protein
MGCFRSSEGFSQAVPESGGRNKTQIKMIVPPALGSEHHPQDGKYRQSLAKEFRERTKSERRSTGMRLVAVGAPISMPAGQLFDSIGVIVTPN